MTVTGKKVISNHNNTDFFEDEFLPGLAVLLDTERLREILKPYLTEITGEINSLEITYVRYKPATSCLAAYSMHYTIQGLEKVSEVLFYGKCYTKSDFENARQKAALNKWVELPGFPSVILLPEQSTIIYSFPNDCEIDGMDTIFNSRKLVRILYEHLPHYPVKEWRISDKRLRVTVVRYKPEKRAVLRIDTRVINRQTNQKSNLRLYIRNYCNHRGAAIYNCMKDLYNELHNKSKVSVPQPFVYLPEKQFLIIEALEGEPLLSFLTKPDKIDYIKRTAQSLASLHQVGKIDLPERSVTDLLQDAHATGTTLTHIVPEMRNEVNRILKTLDKQIPANEKNITGFVHGDFYYGQVLIHNDSEAILDFDRSYLGDPLADVGNFCAHLRLLKIQKRLTDITSLTDAFIETYIKDSGRKIDYKKLTFWTVFGLFQLSVSPFRSLELNWRTKTIDIIKECLDIY